MFVMSEVISEIGAFNDCHERSVVPLRNSKCCLQCRIASSSTYYVTVVSWKVMKLVCKSPVNLSNNCGVNSAKLYMSGILLSMNVANGTSTCSCEG